MRALVKREKNVGIWMEEVPLPKIGKNDVLIRPHYTSICGTDIHIYKWDAWAQKTIPIPLVIGHEFSGEIVECGSDVKDYNIGDLVTGEGHITCGHCEACLTGERHLCAKTKVIGLHTHGCFAEYFPLPAENVYKLPPRIDPKLASIFDPFGNATHTLLSFNLVGEDILITGAGPIGLMAVAICKFAGARSVVVTDMNDYRLKLAKSLGADSAINITKTNIKDAMNALAIDKGFSLGFELSGNSQALNTLLETTKTGAKIALLGILPPGCSVDWDLIIFKMLTLKGIYGREIFRTWYQMCHMLEGGLNIRPIITHYFPIDDFQKGFDIMLSGNCGKVVLEWPKEKEAELPIVKESEIA